MLCTLPLVGWEELGKAGNPHLETTFRLRYGRVMQGAFKRPREQIKSIVAYHPVPAEA